MDKLSDLMRRIEAEHDKVNQLLGIVSDQINAHDYDAAYASLINLLDAYPHLKPKPKLNRWKMTEREYLEKKGDWHHDD